MSSSGDRQDAHATARQAVTLDILTEVLARAAGPARLGEYLTGQMRELTGARTVVLLQYPLSGTASHPRVIRVSPERRSEQMDAEACAHFARLQAAAAAPHVWTVDQATVEGARILRQLHARTGLSLPLNVADTRVGALLFFDFPEAGRRAPELVSLLEPLGTVVALALRNALLFEQQEAVIEERTRRVRESEGRLRSLFEAVPDSIFVDDAEGRILEVNPAACEMLGCDREDIEGKYISDFSTGFDRARVLENARLLREETSLFFTDEHRRPDGRLVPVEVRLTSVGDPALGVRIAIARDLTERRKAEAEKAELQARLAHSQRIEAIGRLAGGIAHDFNNVLTPILAHAELALERLPAEDALRDDVKAISDAALRARDLVRQILVFSRQEQQPRTLVNVAALVGEAMHLLRASLPATIAIAEHIDPDCGETMAVASDLYQVLMNLGTNALHAMRESGGTLTVSLTRDSPPGQPEAEAAGWIHLAVSDTGHGMDRPTLERIFDPYFTTKQRGEGTGLGLAVVHGIVSSCGGSIAVDSSPGHGTRFDIHLPAHAAPAAPQEAPAARPRGSERVLFVDDEPAIAALGKKILESLGYTVTAVTDGVEALRVFSDDPSAFDLVITDYTLPHITGVDLTRELLGRRPGLPVVICTGFSETLDEEKARAVGARLLLMKPFSIDRLAQAARAALTVGSGLKAQGSGPEQAQGSRLRAQGLTGSGA